MTPRITPLKFPKIIDAAKHLPSTGKTLVTENNLFCLDIRDAYIHELLPMLGDEKINKPDYFGIKSVGAHITIIYPEEAKKIHNYELRQEHRFLIKDIVAAEIGLKTYYVLLVESPSLLKLRKKYGLPELLSFKGYSIGFHITIGTMAKWR